MKKVWAVLLTICMMCSCFGAIPASAAEDSYIYLRPENFKADLGTWNYSVNEGGSYEKQTLQGISGGNVSATKPAVAPVDIPADGTYFVWARTKDFDTNPGARKSKIAVGELTLPNELGDHQTGAIGWKWQLAGTADLKKGSTEVKAIDFNANNARIDLIVLTTNQSFTPSDDFAVLAGELKKYQAAITESKPQEPEGNLPYHAPQGDTLFVTAKAFQDHLGTWSITENEAGSYGDGSLHAAVDGKPAATQPAVCTVDLPSDGTYFVWARTKDFDTAPGSRRAKINVNGTLLPNELGSHQTGVTGWKWQLAGELNLKKGETVIQAVDTAANRARVDLICLTKDQAYMPPQEDSDLTGAVKEYAAKLLPTKENPSVTSKPSSAPEPTLKPLPEGTTQTREGFTYYIVRPSHFEGSLGGWGLVSNDKEAYESTCLIGGQNAVKAADATVKVNIPKDGDYYFWTRSKDFADAKSGTRTYQLGMDGKALGTVVGKHGNPGFHWESAGKATLFAGESTLSLMDVGGDYARNEMVLVTDDPEFIPADDGASVESLVKKLYYDPENVPIEAPGEDPLRPDDEIAVKLNGDYMHFDVPPILMNDRTLVPFRAIFEALGCSVSWDDDNQTAIGERNGKIVKLVIDSNIASVDGKSVELDQSAVLVNDRTLVPLRFVSESLGASVQWNEETQTVSILAEEVKSAFFIRPESFVNYGTWRTEAGYTGAFEGTCIVGTSPAAGQDPEEFFNETTTQPAAAVFNIVKDGTYKIWVHAKDFETNQPGSRYFHIAVNGKQVDQPFGTHGKDGFAWVSAGEFLLQAGENQLEFLDTSKFFARCDGVFITEDLDLIPPESYEAVAAIASPLDSMSNLTADFPVWAKSKNEPTEQLTIENDTTKVVFLKVDSSKGPVIQNEIYGKDADNWVKLKDRNEEFGYLVMKAVSSKTSTYSDEFPVFKQIIENNGNQREIITTNIYKSGVPVWFIPTGMEQTAGNQVKLTFDNPLASMEVLWEMDEKEDPLVTVQATFHEKGAYSIGAFNGREYLDSEYSFALAPFRVQGKRVKEEPGVASEHYMFTPMGTVTLPAENSLVPGKAVTKGVVVDPNYINYGWVYKDTSKFGIGMRGTNGGVRGGIFAPLFGLDDCNFEPGDSYTLQYRTINRVEDWFDTYTHITQDLFDLYDYRNNFYCSLNETIFNTRDLMMNDEYGGWDNDDKGYYNMESRNVTSQANPMEALQVYLLTEDKEYLEKRTIPTIANLLTRGNFHFNSKTERSSVDYVNGKEIPMPIGQPMDAFNLNVLGGMYEMSRGMIPELLRLGIDKSEKAGVVNSYGSIPGFSNDIVMYKYTGEQQYYDRAVEAADKYIDNFMNKPQNVPPTFISFVFISYYPNLASLLDVYDMTGDKKYLDAAVETGKWLSTCLWVPGIDGEKKDSIVTITPEMIKERGSVKEDAAFYWHGNYQWVRGSEKGVVGPPQNLDSVETEIVPGWLPSRVGLGLEQATTFNNSYNMIMNSWAGDMAKLAAYSGEEYFNMVARNAVIGRFGNYPGYYQDRLMTFHMKPEFPYTGPELTHMYYHHIPPFLAMLEDFIINEMINKAKGNISYESLRQQGYAYFNSNQYGHKPGRFYDQQEMWLWLDRGIVEPDSKQIDWVAARKDGVFGLALMNEDETEISTVISLGEKIEGGSSFSGTATVYNADGEQEQISVTDGKFTVTIPAKGFKALIMEIPGVKAPAFAQVELNYDTEVGNTVIEHEKGKAYVFQMTPESYYAYVYVTDLPKETKRLTMRYKIGTGEEQTISTQTYPYEFIIPVEQSKDAFTFTLETEGVDGKKEVTSSHKLEAKIKQ